MPVTRREVLIAATTLGVVASAATAAQPQKDAFDEKPGGGDEKPGKEKAHPKSSHQLKLKVTLTDGQVLTLNASEVVLDFGDNGQLVAKPSGILPFGQKVGIKPLNPDPVFEGKPVIDQKRS